MPIDLKVGIAKFAKLHAVARAQAAGREFKTAEVRVAAHGKHMQQNAQAVLDLLHNRELVTAAPFESSTSVNAPNRSIEVVRRPSTQAGVVAEIFGKGIGDPLGPGHEHAQELPDGTVRVVHAAYDPAVPGARYASMNQVASREATL